MAPPAQMDPAAGVVLLSVQKFNADTFTFLCSDAAKDFEWTVERTFRCVKQLFRTLVENNFLDPDAVFKPECTVDSVERFMRHLLRVCMLIR